MSGRDHSVCSIFSLSLSSALAWRVATLIVSPAMGVVSVCVCVCVCVEVFLDIQFQCVCTMDESWRQETLFSQLMAAMSGQL